MNSHDIALLLIANRFGFGKYWSGYVFAKHPKDEYSLYIADEKMAILSNQTDEDGDRTIVADAYCFSMNELNAYFSLDYTKTSLIDWFQPVNFVLLCDKPKLTRDNIIYFMWPAVKMNFHDTLVAHNTIVVHDKLTSHAMLEELKAKANETMLIDKVDFWTTLKLLTFSERMGYFAPKACQESTVHAYEKQLSKLH